MPECRKLAGLGKDFQWFTFPYRMVACYIIKCPWVNYKKPPFIQALSMPSPLGFSLKLLTLFSSFPERRLRNDPAAELPSELQEHPVFMKLERFMNINH
jgi:hypothetical protein